MGKTVITSKTMKIPGGIMDFKNLPKYKDYKKSLPAVKEFEEKRFPGYKDPETMTKKELSKFMHLNEFKMPGHSRPPKHVLLSYKSKPKRKEEENSHPEEDRESKLRRIEEDGNTVNELSAEGSEILKKLNVLENSVKEVKEYMFAFFKGKGIN